MGGYAIVSSEENMKLVGKIILCQTKSKKDIDDIYANVKITSNELDLTRLKRMLLSVKHNGIFSLVLLCSIECSSLILQLASHLEMSSRNFVWIVYGRGIYLTKDKPENILLLTVKHNQTPHECLNATDPAKR